MEVTLPDLVVSDETHVVQLQHWMREVDAWVDHKTPERRAALEGLARDMIANITDLLAALPAPSATAEVRLHNHLKFRIQVTQSPQQPI